MESEDEEFLKSLGLQPNFLPDEGPPVNLDLLRRLVAGATDDKESALLFRLIAAYRNWNASYLECQLEKIRRNIAESN